MTAPGDVVREWMDAFDALDLDRLLSVAHPGIRLDTGRHVVEGHDGVRAFAQRQTFGVRLHGENLRLIDDGSGNVFTEDAIEFRSVDDGSTMGREITRARWVVRDGRIAEYAPHDGDLPE